MSPRSEEFLAQARERLAAGRDSVAAGHPEAGISQAYYAMLYAARAALSEEDRYAKTHTGTWGLFSELFVRPGRIDEATYQPTKAARHHRERGDYDAVELDADLARATTDDAERFIRAVERMLRDD